MQAHQYFTAALESAPSDLKLTAKSLMVGRKKYQKLAKKVIFSIFVSGHLPAENFNDCHFFRLSPAQASAQESVDCPSHSDNRRCISPG